MIDKLLKYGALVAAISGVSNALGQIIYTDVDPDFTSSFGDNFEIDLDNDSFSDIQLHQNDAIYFTSPPSNGLAGFSFTQRFIRHFEIDSYVGEYTEFINRSGTFFYEACQYSNYSVWCGAVDDYIGIRFKIAGSTHYGWARLDVASDALSFTIKDFAYNSRQGESILTGQQTLGIQDFRGVEFSYFVNNNNVLTISSNETMEDIKVYNVVGKEVMASSLSTRNEQVDVSALSTGVYLAKVSIGSQSETFKFVKR